MVDSSHSSNASQSDAGDPLLAFTTAMRDFWLLGAATVENALAQGKADGASPSFEPALEQMTRTSLAFRELAEANMSALAGMRKPEGTAGAAADLLPLMARAYAIAGEGGLRYWRRLAQTYAAHQSAIVRSLAAGGGDASRAEADRRALIEEFRVCLREIGDVSLQEARAFQSELEKLAAEVATAASPPEEAPEYRRRWKAKS